MSKQHQPPPALAAAQSVIKEEREEPSQNEHASNPTQVPNPNKDQKTIGQYILGKSIGEGTFGKVKLGTHILTNEKVAIKILEKGKILDVADVERVAREIHILKIVRHPQVVQLYEIIETQKKLYLIMEYASGGELFDYIVQVQRVKEREACRFFQQIIAGVEYISRLNVVHRDLKPENLLLDYDKGIKLVDFGLSNTYKQGELLKTACGSPCYAAPEMIAGKKYHGTNVDIWSCGVILFALICGYLPFEDPNTSNLYKKILNADFQVPKFVSDEAKDLITCILNTDPEKRYKIEDIRKHPWFNLVKCEENFRGTIVGIDPVPIDPSILQSLSQYKIDVEYARKCLEANKHNHITATYFLLLKKHLKSGGDSIADPRSPKYDPKYFFRRQPAFAKLTTAQEAEKKNLDGKAVLSEGLLLPGNNRSRAGSQPPAIGGHYPPQAPTRLRRIADGLIDMERYTPNSSSIRQQHQQHITAVNRNRRRAESITPGINFYGHTQQQPIHFMHNDGSIEYMHALAQGDGSAEMILTSNNLSDLYSGKERSPSLSPATIRLNHIRAAANKQQMRTRGQALSNSFFYPYQQEAGSPCEIPSSSGNLYTSATPLMPFKTIEEQEGIPMFFPQNLHKRAQKGATNHQRNASAYQTVNHPHSNLMQNYTNTVISHRLETPHDTLPQFPFMQVYGGNSSAVHNRRRQANYSMNDNSKQSMLNIRYNINILPYETR